MSNASNATWIPSRAHLPDPRALFSCTSTTLRSTPNRRATVPPRPAAFTQCPQVRFIGHPQLEANDPFLLPWVEKIALWIEEGRTQKVLYTQARGLVTSSGCCMPSLK